MGVSDGAHVIVLVTLDVEGIEAGLGTLIALRVSGGWPDQRLGDQHSGRCRDASDEK